MAMKMNMSLKQTQSLMMTPQLQQAIKLLTLTHLEMQNVIAQEMVENPMLEESGSEVTKEEIQQRDNTEIQNKEATADDFKGPDLVDSGKDQFDWEKYIESHDSHSSTPRSSADFNGNNDQPNYENMVSKSMTLQEHLEWQLKMESLLAEEWKIAHAIIHNIDEEGYLDANFENFLAESKLDREDAFEILKMIQNLDPIGCGSRSLEECLLVQAQALEVRAPLVEIIIKEHLNDLHKKDYASISKKTGVDKEKIKEAEMIIMGFNPKPGRLVGIDETHYIVPDIYVKEIGGEFVIRLNDEGVPRLRISNLYKSILKAQHSGDDNAKEYIQDKLRAAMWLIKSIENRQKTIEKVANAIVKYQPEFFRKGPIFLRPMILKDIANEIGMHESTVSRVTTNKYMHTPIGVFELKYFFNTGIGGKNGGIDIASESLKLKIKELVDNENTRKPLSDQKISEILSTKDIVVARRTVAKYREMMNILPSSKRKKLN